MRPQTCIECQEAISNPICPDCIEREIEAWLLEREPSLVPYIKKRNTSISSWVTKCIVCGQKMSLCGHCFTKEILVALKQNTKDNLLIDDFVALFNFEIG